MSTTTAEVTTAELLTDPHMLTRDVRIDGKPAGAVVEDRSAYAGHYRFVAAVVGMGSPLGWHSSLESAVAAIAEVHELRSLA